MAGVHPKFTDTPITYPVNVTVTGGQLVSADTSVIGVDAVKPSTAGDRPVGVAMTDALPVGSDVAGSTANAPAYCTVARECVIPVTYAAGAPFGALLKAAASGAVTPYLFTSAGRSVSDGVISNATGLTFTITSATAAFTDADEGAVISGTGVGASNHIVTIVNATTVLVAVASTAANTGVTLTIGVATGDTDPTLIVGRCRQTTPAGSVGLAGIQLI
jgi:hypothetical protein